MKNLSRTLNLTPIQREFFEGILDFYKQKKYLNARIIFTNTNNYLPPMFGHGKKLEKLSANEFVKYVLDKGLSVDEHDGIIFVYPNGNTVFGGIVDATYVLETLPRYVRDFGVARALMKLLTNIETTYVQCALKCGNNLVCYYNGRRHVLVKPTIAKSDSYHNYGIGFIVSNAIKLNGDLHLVKMGGFKKLQDIYTTQDLVSKILDIIYSNDRHDGFWHYDPDKQTFSGPYMVLAKVVHEHAQTSGGMKRLTARLISHWLNVPTIILRENADTFLSYGSADSAFIDCLQKEFNTQVKLVYNDVIA